MPDVEEVYDEQDLGYFINSGYIGKGNGYVILNNFVEKNFEVIKHHVTSDF